MKSKIYVNIDSELLNIIRDCSDSDLDSIIQDALSQFLGIRQIWVKSESLEPISKISETSKSIPNKIPVKIDAVSVKKNIPRIRRQPKFVLKIWGDIKGFLSEEFTVDDYWEATKKGGLDYKESAKKITILEHLDIIEEAGKILKIDDKPRKYRKLEKEKNKVSQPEIPQQPEEKLGEIIEHGKDVQERERKVEKEMLT